MDFSAFDYRFSVSERYNESLARLKAFWGRGRVLAAVSIGSVLFFIVLSAVMPIYSFRAYLRHEPDAPLGAAIVFLVVFLVMVGLLVYAVLLTGKNSLVMKRFAHDNGLQFWSVFRWNSNPGPAFSNLGFMRNAAGGEAAGKKLWLYEYRFNSGSGRHPYPNIFVVLTQEIKDHLPSTLFINRKGRLRVGNRARKLTEVSSWDGLDQHRIYTQDGAIDPRLKKYVTTKLVQQLMEIHPTVELQVHGKTLSVFLPGKPVISREKAEALFALLKLGK